MFLQKYAKALNNIVSIGLSVFVLIVVSFGKFGDVPSKIMMAIVSVAVFVILTNVAKYLEQKSIKRCVTWLVKYAYPIFLIHHFVINQVVKHFDLLMVGKLDSYILFVLCLSIIFPISVLVYRLERMILNVK